MNRNGFPVGKIGGIFSNIADTVTSARDFTSRQLDTVMDVSGTVRDTASGAKNAISGNYNQTKDGGIVDSAKSVSPVVWVLAASALAYLFLKKR